MKNKLPRLTLLAIILAAAALVASRDRAGAAGSQPASAANSPADVAYNVVRTPPASASREPNPGDQLLMQAVAKLERRDSISARLRHQVFIQGKQLYGLGSYWQQGTGDELRVRYELQIAGQEANLLQVSNSRYLWVERRLPTGRTVTGLHLDQLRAEAEYSAAQLDELKPGQASWSSVQPELTAYYGGLPSLLASLAKSFTFLPPQAMRLAVQSGPDSQPASIPVFAVVGHWRQEKITELLTKKEKEESPEPPPPITSIPKRLPEEVLILVGQSDLFPYRIEYRKQQTPIAANQTNTPIPFQLSANPMVVLELTDVTFDMPIDAGQFKYVPGDTEWTDQTAAVLERLRRARDEQVATRPAPPRK